ncbi:MAG: L,D-transpeptidase family protein [Pseudomonadota bacterium]
MSNNSVRILCRVFVCLLLFISPLQASESEPSVALATINQSIAVELDRRAKLPGGKTQKKRLGEINAYYKANEYKPVWLSDNKPTQKARQLIQLLRRAPEDGLNPADYDVEALFQKVNIYDPATQADFDVHLSNAFVAYAQHLNVGRVDPSSVTRENVIYPAALSVETILNQGKSTSNIIAYSRLLAPHTPRYQRLRSALSQYRGIAANGGWDRIEEGEVLKPGMEDDRVPGLRKRLAVSGDYKGALDIQSTLYDELLVKAVKYFQWRHGLDVDGVIGGNTLKQLNVLVEDRIAMMEYNLERRRWMQDDYGSYYIFANLADQVVKVVKNEKTLHAELIQVGLPYHRTPVFTDEMEYIEINPYWNVPKSIATNELLPKLKQNPGKLASQNYEVLSNGNVISPTAVSWGNYSKGNFPFRLRQRPGEGNALGRIKFMFPNTFNVYLHDTPSKSNFDKSSRFFSHGCLRLQDPLKMAEVLLGAQGWDRARINGVVASKKRTVVKLEKTIPVHIAYLTSWVNKDGSVHFRRDVYERDTVLGKALSNAGS